MSSGGPDLFVVCKHCGSEVSPYITECPYCGHRLQKRAPKIDREGRIQEKPKRRTPSPTLGRLRRGEIPGIRHDTHPYATALIVALGFIGALFWRTGLVDPFNLVAFEPLKHNVWRLIVAPFIYANTGYTVITLAVIALFGTLLERRHGPVIVLVLFLIGAVAGTAAGVQLEHPNLFGNGHFIDGANGGALALVVAWAIPDLLEFLRDREIEGDLIGAAVLAAVVAVMPLVAPEASWTADAVGVLTGVVIGYPLARLRPV